MTDDLQPATNRIAVMVKTAGFSQLKLNPADCLRFIFMRLSVARIEARLCGRQSPKMAGISMFERQTQAGVPSELPQPVCPRKCRRPLGR